MQEKIEKFIKSPSFIAFVVFFVAGLVVFHELLLGGKVFFSSDAVSARAVAPMMKEYFFETGDYPLWNPYVFSGMPGFHALTFTLFAYFPHILTLPLRAIGASNFWIYFGYFLLAAMGTYWLVRRWTSQIPAIFSGLAFMLTPFLVAMKTAGHGSQMIAVSFIPIIFYSIVRMWEEKSLRWSAISAILLGIQMQRAHIQITYYTLILVGIFSVFQIVKMLREKDKETGKTVLKSSLVPIGALLMAAVIYLPVYNYIEFSTRGGSGGGTGLEYATGWSFHPAEMLTFLHPTFFGGVGDVPYWGWMPFTHHTNYFGILVLILASFALANRKTPHRWFWTSFIGFSLLVSFGKFFGLYELLYKFLPFFNKFRVPSMILILLQFSMAILAGIGFQQVIEKFEKKPTFTIFGIVAGIVAIVSFWLSQNYETIEKFGQMAMQYKVSVNQISSIFWQAVSKDGVISFFIVILGLVAIFWTKNDAVKWKKLGMIFIGLMLLDLWRIDARLIEPVDAYEMKKPFKTTRLIQAIKKSRSDDTYRVFPTGKMFTDKRWARHRIGSVGGYSAAKMQRYQSFMEREPFAQSNVNQYLRMLNVGFIIGPNGKKWQPFEPFLERAFFPKSVKSVQNFDVALDSILSPNFNPKSVAFVETNREIPSNSGQGSATLLYYKLDAFSYEVESEIEQLLVISETFFPHGWVAKIDDKLTEIYAVNGILRGIIVPSGKSVVSMEFAPSDVKLGAILSLSSFLILLILVGFTFRKSPESEV